MGGFTNAELAAAERAAASITYPWQAWDEIEVSARPRDDELAELHEAQEAAKLLRRLLRANAPIDPAMPAPGGEKLSLNGKPTPPRWVCPGFAARGHVTMGSAAWGSAKSLLREEMMACSLLGRPFLGRSMPKLRFMVIDGENSREDVETRWRALGLSDDHLANVHFTGRQKGVKLGRADWNKWLEDEIEAFHPDALIIDSVMRCCLPGLTNEEVTALFDELFVPLADKYDLAVIFTHHHRKAGAKGNLADAALGAMQFSGQADLTFTVATTKKLTITPRADGGFDTLSKFVLHFPKSGRGALLTEDKPEYFEVRGVIDADGALQHLRLDHPKGEPTLDERILAELTQPLGRGALADCLGIHQTGSPFRTALARLAENSEIVKNDDGLYARAE
jgi:hypothetical protein